MTTITLIPQSRSEQHTFPVSANQIQASQISATAPTQQNTVNVSGTLPGKQAKGQLTFINQTNVDVVVQTTIITGKSGISVTFTGPITVPALNPPDIIVTGVATDAGPHGNIPQFDIDEFCCAPNNEVVVKNTTAFTGGRNATPNDQVQQSDIDTAAQGLVTAQKQQEQNNLKAKLTATEQVVSGSNQCKPTITPDHPVGSQATTVTVSVSVTCTEEVYDTAAAQSAGTSLLATQATQDLGSAYRLAGNVAVNVTGGYNGAPIALKTQGLWAYAFSTTRLNQLASLVAGKSSAEAREILLSQPGIANIQLPTTSDLPPANRIHMKVQVP